MGEGMGAKAIFLKGDARTLEHAKWQHWLSNAAKLANAFGAVEDDPFAYNEAATVSLLTAAATQCGMLGLAEFVSTKRRRSDRRANVRGRCDFWMCSDNRSWAFEFKQEIYRGGYHKVDTIVGWLDRAHEDAKSLSRTEADKRFGGLIVPLYWAEEIDQGFIENILTATEDADFAWHLEPDSEHAGSTFILFREAI